MSIRAVLARLHLGDDTEFSGHALQSLKFDAIIRNPPGIVLKSVHASFHRTNKGGGFDRNQDKGIHPKYKNRLTAAGSV
jgi:hypothetical protein